MSRSYKKPYCTDQQQGRKSSSSPRSSVYQKRRAARKVRQANKLACNGYETREVKSGKKYRLEYDPWNIRDWSFPDNSPKGRRK